MKRLALALVLVPSLARAEASVNVLNLPATNATVTPTQVALSTSDVQLLPANPTRKALEFYLSGPSTCTANLGFGAAAVSGVDVTYGANTPGQTWFVLPPKQSIHAISNTASGCVAIVREYN